MDDLVKRLRGPVKTAAQDLIDRYFGNSDKCLATIPADPERDADLILVNGLSEAANRIEKLEAENARLRAAINKLDHLAAKDAAVVAAALAEQEKDNES